GLDEFVNKPIVKNCKAMSSEEEPKGNPQMDLQDQGVIDSGCSRHMTGNMSYLTNYEEIDGGYVAFGGNPKGGKITEKGKALLVKGKNSEHLVIGGFAISYSNKERCQELEENGKKPKMVIQALKDTSWIENVEGFAYISFDYEAVHKELGDSLVRAATTASSLEAEQDNSNITKTRSKATLNEPSSP
ncbi:hypothetical protein Tco_0573144, partial [Tanacetum coccineum]